MVTSRVLQKLRAGGFVRVVGVNRVMDPWLVEVIGKMGFDLIWLDLEHRAHGYDVIDPISLACRATGIDLMVRIPKAEYGSPMRALEGGAQGIMVPHCRSAEEARQWVRWCRYPPLGERGFDSVGADADFGLSDPKQYLQCANRETFLVLQIEDRVAVECVEEIAAVEGVDLLFVGPADLGMSLGVPFQFEHPTMQSAIDRVAQAAAKAGIWWGTVTGSPALAQQALDRGARMVTCANDHFLLLDGLREAYQQFSEIRVR
ncbi:MAG TPA: aldolase/citrate lyase family protein [Terriglobia bacterium]|nr:aldolase/citrate lyase family protein [Terriglobia bacterium]